MEGIAEAPARKPASRSLAGLRIGEILLAHTAITPEKLAEALAAQQERGGRLGEVLVSLKSCSEEQVLKALAAQLELPYQMRVGTEEVSQELVAKVPINFAKQARLLPLRMEGDHVVAAMADPLDTGAVDSVRMLLGVPVSPLIVPTQSILDCINSVYDRAKNEAEQLVDDLEAGRRTSSTRTTRRPSSGWSTRCCSAPPRSGPATSTSSRRKGTSACASGWTACCRK